MNVRIVTTRGDIVFDQIDSYLKEAGIVCSEFSGNDAIGVFQEPIPQIGVFRLACGPSRLGWIRFDCDCGFSCQNFE